MLRHSRQGQGEPVVLVHGFLGSSEAWSPTLSCLSRHFDVIAPNLPGFGQSKDVFPLNTIASAADALLGLADALALERFSLVGHSYGGYVAQEFALDNASRVSRLVLYATAASGALRHRFETGERSITRVAEEGVSAVVDSIVRSWFVAGEAHPYYALCRAAAEGVTAETAVTVMRAIQAWSAEDRLREIAMPVLVIGGDQDRSVSPLDLVALWQRIPSARLAVVPRAAHNVHLEQTGLFNQIVLDFLQSAE